MIPSTKKPDDLPGLVEALSVFGWENIGGVTRQHGKQGWFPGDYVLPMKDLSIVNLNSF